jgi:hypothetical protein
MKVKDSDLIKTWMLEAGTEKPSENLKNEVLKQIEKSPLAHQPIISPYFWKIMGFFMVGAILYFQFDSNKLAPTSSWLHSLYFGYKVDFNLDFFAGSSPSITYALIIFSLYLCLSPTLIQWWEKRLVS